MQKRHFEALARALLDTRPASSAEDTSRVGKARRETWSHSVARIADVCAVSNVSFRRAQFFDACGFTAEYGRT